jgi:hypothetical protein
MSEILQRVSEDLRKMTPAEFREALMDAGIIDAEGNLTPPYQDPVRKKRTPRRKPSVETP